MSKASDFIRWSDNAKAAGAAFRYIVRLIERRCGGEPDRQHRIYNDLTDNDVERIYLRAKRAIR